MTATVSVAALPPLSGLTLSQAGAVGSAATLQFIVPPPLLDSVSVCAEGFVPPLCIVNDKVDGLTAMIGGASTVKATCAVWGVFVAPAAVTMISVA